MNSFAELQLLPMMEFSFNTLPHYFSIASLQKCVSDFTADVFFRQNISTKKDTTKDKNINISCLKLDFKNLRQTFWAQKYRSTMQQILVPNFFYNKKLELLEITKERNHKSHAQNWKICMLCVYWEYLPCPQSNASGSFSQTCINIVEQRLKFSHFEGTLIP